MLGHTFNPSTYGAEAGESLNVQNKPSLQNEFQIARTTQRNPTKQYIHI